MVRILAKSKGVGFKTPLCDLTWTDPIIMIVIIITTTTLIIIIIIIIIIYTTIKTKDVCLCVCHVYAGHLPIDGSASHFTQS